jgi:hypothetical protein
MFHCEAVDLDFLGRAPVRRDFAVRIGHPPSEVFAAFAHEPAIWGDFYPGFDRTGRYHTPVPHGVGSRRTARFMGVSFEETILAWDEGARWTFRVDSTHAPVFQACIEDYHFDAEGSGATLVRWTLAYTPRLAFKLAGPLLGWFLPTALTRAGHNLERGPWFSTPPND